MTEEQRTRIMIVAISVIMLNYLWRSIKYRDWRKDNFINRTARRLYHLLARRA